jgi:ribonucleoside-diphosphate reductase alpha chain
VFPNFKGSIYDKKQKIKLRNATVTSIAPTGTLSIIAGCSSGIEPVYAITYIRHIMDRDKLVEIHPLFKDMAERFGFFSKDLIDQITIRSGSVKNISEVPDMIKRLFPIAHDISPEWHIRLQAAFQKYTDNAVSKTINFSKDATEKDVEDAYKLAYELGCKGITVYRDGSRKGQVLSIQGDSAVVTPPILNGINPGKKKVESNRSKKDVEKSNAGDTTKSRTINNTKTIIQEEEDPTQTIAKIKPRPRPSTTSGVTEKIRTGCGNLYVTINRDENGLCEVFTRMGKSGGCANAQSEAVARLVSLALRSGIAPEAIVRQLRSIRCPAQVMTPGGMVFSCPDAIAQAMEHHLDEKVERNNIINDSGKAPTCPDCGGMVEYMEGCLICRSCGYTECE